jgi:hypothetical protein
MGRRASKVCPLTREALSRVDLQYLNYKCDAVNLDEVKVDFPEVEGYDLFGKSVFAEQRGISAKQAQRRVITDTNCSYNMVMIDIGKPGQPRWLWATCTPSAEAGDIHFANKTCQARTANLWQGGAFLVTSGYA